MWMRAKAKASVRLRLILLALIAIACSTLEARDVQRSDRPANPASRGVYNEAVRILESIEKTKYQHRTKIDEEKGEYYCDCSGFVGYVLNRTVGKDGTGALGDGRERPLAMHYEQFFAKAPTDMTERGGQSPFASRTAQKGTVPGVSARWQRIVRLADARPGDIIAWRHEVPKPGNTGHVVIVAQRPVLEDDGLVRVVFIDSTTRPMAGDTRPKGTSGIGRGTMWFKIDEKGRPVAHIRGARDAQPKAEAISVGRALPVKKASSRRAA
jgi:hypothetical protein